MKVYSRRILVKKSKEEVRRIIRSSAYSGQCRMDGDAFAIQCPKRGGRGQIMLIPVSGKLTECEDGIFVTLELRAGLGMMFGLMVLTFGLIGMLLGLLLPVLGRGGEGVLTMGMGALITFFFWMRQIETVDLLEHKLTRPES